jgi:hypothetical protein
LSSLPIARSASPGTPVVLLQCGEQPDCAISRREQMQQSQALFDRLIGGHLHDQRYYLTA